MDYKVQFSPADDMEAIFDEADKNVKDLLKQNTDAVAAFKDASRRLLNPETYDADAFNDAVDRYCETGEELAKAVNYRAACRAERGRRRRATSVL